MSKNIQPLSQVGIRITDQTKKFMSAFSPKAASAIQESIEIFMWLYRATLAELQDRFTKPEIVALLDSFENIQPTWQVMVNPSVIVRHLESVEATRQAISSHGADPVVIVEKIQGLTSAQVTVLQSELVNFWNSPFESRVGDFGNLFNIIRPIPSSAPIHFRDKI